MICNKCGYTGYAFYKGNPTICKTCFKARNAAWQKKNPARVRANASKSAARKRGAVVCTCCTIHDFIPVFQRAIDNDMEVDHIKPCADGGMHCVSNLQLLSREENLQKDARR